MDSEQMYLDLMDILAIAVIHQSDPEFDLVKLLLERGYKL